MSDKQRAAFEKCFYEEICGSAVNETLAWEVWQAAVASVVVNLGDPSNFTGCASDDFYWRNVVERSIEEAGASYK